MQRSGPPAVRTTGRRAATTSSRGPFDREGRSALRSKTAARGSRSEPGLEPLPVFDDGVAVDPESRRPLLQIPTRGCWRGVVNAVRAVLGERSEVRARSPWNNVGPIPEVQPRAATFYSTFNRMIALAPARLAGLDEWWRRAARDGRLRVSRRLSLEEPRPLRGGTWRRPAGCAARSSCGRSRSSCCCGRTSEAGRE